MKVRRLVVLAFALPLAAQTPTIINSGDGSGNKANVNASGYLEMLMENSSIAVTGTFWQATQPVSAPDPCFGAARSFFSISQTANTRVITGTSAKKIYFCSFNVVAADAENISVVEGTGSTCATSTIAVPGFPASTAAAGWNFAANGGIAANGGVGSMAGTSVNADDVCVFQSGSGRVAGGGSYVVQ